MKQINTERDYKSEIEQIRKNIARNSKIHEEVVLRVGKDFFGKDFNSDIEVTNEIAKLSAQDFEKAMEIANLIREEKEKRQIF